MPYAHGEGLQVEERGHTIIFLFFVVVVLIIIFFLFILVLFHDAGRRIIVLGIGTACLCEW